MVAKHKETMREGIFTNTFACERAEQYSSTTGYEHTRKKRNRDDMFTRTLDQLCESGDHEKVCENWVVMRRKLCLAQTRAPSASAAAWEEEAEPRALRRLGLASAQCLARLQTPNASVIARDAHCWRP